LSSGSAEILKLSRAKVSEDVTIAFIQNSGHRYALSASEILYLRSEGVSDRVLATMLNPQSHAPDSHTAAPAATSGSDVPASAPQYVAPPATSVVEQTSPASTVYVVGTTPTYYSFYDPWPYRYDPWPYYYPYFSLGFYWGWGGCYSGYWNNYCHNGYYGRSYCHNGYYGHNGNYQSHLSHGSDESRGRPRDGSQPRNGNSPTANAVSRPNGQPGMSGSVGSQARGGIQPPSTATRAAVAAPRARPTSTWSGNANPSAVARASQPNAVAARGTQVGAPAGYRRSGVENRIVAGASGGRVETQSPRAGYVGRGATVGSAPASAPSAWNRPGGQVVNRYASPASSPQRIVAGSNAGYRGGGNFVSAPRPSMGSSYGVARSAGGFRSGGSYGGGGAARMSSGGGYHGGGAARGGGGGGFRR
jgi:hypothetical protein